MNAPKGYLIDNDNSDDDSRDIPKFEGMVTFQGDFKPLDEFEPNQDS